MTAASGWGSGGFCAMADRRLLTGLGLSFVALLPESDDV